MANRALEGSVGKRPHPIEAAELRVISASIQYALRVTEDAWRRLAEAKQELARLQAEHRGKGCLPGER